MARELNGRVLLDVEEVKEAYGWTYPTLYYWQKKGLLSEPEMFFANRKKAYWYKDELDRVRDRPKSEIDKGNPNPPVPRVFSNPKDAAQLLERIKAAGSGSGSASS